MVTGAPLYACGFSTFGGPILPIPQRIFRFAPHELSFATKTATSLRLFFPHDA